MIKSLSPYYITTNFENATTAVISTYYILNLYVWSGDKNTPPAEPNYTITKQNVTGTAVDDVVNVARVLNSFLTVEAIKGSSTSLLDGNNQKWVKHSVYYSDDLLTEENETTTLLTRGYGYGNEGMNPQPPTDKVYLTGNEFNVNREGVFCFPIYLDEV